MKGMPDAAAPLRAPRDTAPAFDPSLGLLEARAAALREVSRLLATPEDLQRLDAIRCAQGGCWAPPAQAHAGTRSADAAARRTTTEAALSGALSAQVAESLSGRGALDAASASLRALLSKLGEIDALCVACRDLVRHDDLVKSLAVVRANFGAALSKAAAILDLPEEAAETLGALANETQLIVVFEELSALDARCAEAQRLFDTSAAAAPTGRRARNEELRARLGAYFSKVDAARVVFEDALWGTLRSALHDGADGAPLLVRALHVVQEQAALEAARASAEGAAAPPSRRYPAAARAAVEASIDARCARLLPLRIATTPEGELEIGWTEVMADLEECYRGLEELHDHAVPCFPPSFDIWQVVVRRYHVRIVQFVDRLAHLPLPPSNSELLELVRLHDAYVAMLDALGTPPEWSAHRSVPLPPPPPDPDEEEGAHGGKGKGKKGKGGGSGKGGSAGSRDAASRAAAAAARVASAEAGGNWAGGGVVTADAAARAMLVGAAHDTVGLGIGLAKGVGHLVTAGISLATTGIAGGADGGGSDAAAAAAAEAAFAEAMASPPLPPPPSADCWLPGTGLGWERLLDLYVRRLHDSTSGWMANMVAADLAGPPQQEESGRLWTPAGVDFFRIINDQLEAVTAVTRGELLVRSVVAVGALMLDFQRLQNGAVARPQGELSLEQLAAYVNNNERCYDLSNETLEALKEASPDPQLAARLDVLEVAHQGFLDTARAALAKGVAAMFADPGLVAVFAALFSSPDWWTGGTAATLAATMEDYLQDIGSWLSEPFAKRFAASAMERCVGAYCAALLTQCKAVKTATMARMALDEAALRAVFAPHVKPAALNTMFAALTDLRELASASTEKDMAAAFGSMMAHTPGTTPAVVERILALREDVPKAVRKQVAAACVAQWEEKQGLGPHGLAAVGAAVGGAAAAIGGAVAQGTSAVGVAIAEAVARTRGRFFGFG